MNEKVQALMREIVVVNNDRLLLELSVKFQKLPESEQRKAFAGERRYGYFYLVRNDDVASDTVLECVPSLEGGDAITGLYKNHSALATVGEAMKTRKLLIDALAQKVGLSHEAIGVDDKYGRGRTLGVEELSIGQLIDLLSERMGTSVMKTDNHAIEAPGASK